MSQFLLFPYVLWQFYSVDFITQLRETKKVHHATMVCADRLATMDSFALLLSYVFCL